MGPFRLMDLIGLDVNFAATRSMWEQTFGEPRYRPHPIQARLVEQDTLGRKTGRGFYNYESSQAPPRLDRPAATPDNSGAVLIGEGTWAPGLAERVAAAGYAVVEGQNREPVAALVVAGREEGARQILENLDRELAAEVPVLCQVCDQTLGEAAAGLAGRRRVFGFDGLFAARGQALCVVASPGADAAAGLRVEAFLVSLGIRVEWIADGAGLVLPRIMAMLANEAAFALGDGTADEPTIDLAMKLGANYPVGPLGWLRRIGPAKVLRVLEHLRAVFAEERYRVAPLLRRWAHDADALEPGRHGPETIA
jgi:3-hydroxybutyryl-CoA dehydrogenase